MMDKNFKVYLIFGGVGLAALAFLLGRCSAPLGDEEVEAVVAEGAQDVVWTCSMHPQVQQPSPGDCPICGMDLIPLGEDGDGKMGPRELSMSKAARALADIQTSEVERRFPVAEVRLVGKLAYDQTKVKSLTARFPARIGELYVNFVGVPVKQGDHLARVYSPDLLTAQSELLTAYRFDPDSAATRAAREKLLLWDLLPDQVETIIERGEAQSSFELRAPISGVVVQKKVQEGDYVETGQPLFQIVDLSRLWLMLEAFESDLAWIRFGQEVEFSVEAYPGQTFHGRVAFIEPELDRRTRTVTVRVNVANEERKLKPGMFAKATAHARVAQAGNVYAPEMAGRWISPMHPEIVKDEPGQCDICGMDLVPAEELGYVQDADTEPPIVAPASAVLRTGKRAVVYVEKPDAKRPTYEGREIRLGPRAGDMFVAEAGLKEGERVVTHGAFKIDSALQIKAKPSMMSLRAEDEKENEGEAPEGRSEAGHRPRLAVVEAKAALPAYLALQSALAGDDLGAAKAATAEVMEAVGHDGPLDAVLHAMMEADSLDAMRRPHFETLSEALIDIVSENAGTIGMELYRMRCPMVYSDRGADWLQADEELRNPYFGSMMLKCGNIVERFGTANGREGTRM